MDQEAIHQKKNTFFCLFIKQMNVTITMSGNLTREQDMSRI